MVEFIVVHENGEERMVNLAWVEEVRPDENNNATIYFAFQSVNCIEQDYIKADETYNEIKSQIWR